MIEAVKEKLCRELRARASSRESWSRAARQLLYVTSGGRVMVVDYTVEGDSFSYSKPRPWTDKLIGTTSGSLGFGLGHPAFDLTRDGRRVIAWEPQEAKGTQGQPARYDAAELVRRTAPALAAIWEVS